MADNYAIYPAVGVARVGNSETDFYLAPDEIGGLPKDCDASGNETPGNFSTFKDSVGKIKRQAQKFRVYRNDEELTLDHQNVESIEWTVHLANKKSDWYNFHEQKGNLLFGTANSYQSQGVLLRNSKLKMHIDRQKLIIDPGPRIWYTKTIDECDR